MPPIYDAVSLYCGAGGIDDGLWQTGRIKVKVAIDIEPDMCETIKLNHPETEVICGQVSDYATTLPKVQAVVGGPPCPTFSRANSFRDFDMCEVNNFWKVVELIKPDIYLMENVPDVIKALPRDDNHLVQVANYGVPQKRVRRIYTNLPLPIATHEEKPQQRLDGPKPKKWVTIREALKINDVMSKTEKMWTLAALEAKHPIMFKKHKPNHLDELCKTVIAKDYNKPDQYLTDGKMARKYTNEEAAIFQGFRSDYKFHGGKSSVRRQIGNAVPPTVIREFFRGLY